MTVTPTPRLPALDWMRGLVMLLMTVDHASDLFNRHAVHQDSFYLGALGADLNPHGSVVHFLTRWAAHLCAPTFLFLAGCALALSVERRQAAGERSIDKHLLQRGLLLIVLEAWMSIAFKLPLLQVLYAIGASLCCMVLLRRLPTLVLIGIALGWLILGEAAVGAMGLKPVLGSGPLPETPFWAALTVFPSVWILGFQPDLGFTQLWGFGASMYPLFGWLAILMLGWAFGRWLLAARTDGAALESRAVRLLLIWGSAALLVFLVQRGINGYGNFWLERTDDSWLRWLQVSKYPPSLAYAALELGLMAFCLAGFFGLQARGPASDRNPLLILGQTALFYYLLHIHVMALAGVALGSGMGAPRFAVEGAWIGAALTALALLPACVAYRRYKRRHPQGLTRFV